MSTITNNKTKQKRVAVADASVVSLPFQDEQEDVKTGGAGQSKSYTRTSL